MRGILTTSLLFLGVAHAETKTYTVTRDGVTVTVTQSVTVNIGATAAPTVAKKPARPAPTHTLYPTSWGESGGSFHDRDGRSWRVLDDGVQYRHPDGSPHYVRGSRPFPRDGSGFYPTRLEGWEWKDPRGVLYYFQTVCGRLLLDP